MGLAGQAVLGRDHRDMTTSLPDPDAFRTRPWRRVPQDAFGPADKVPTMLSRMERRLYLWLAEHWATGVGSIVDLGSFVGGSTACLAQGRARAGGQQTVHAFDRFRASEPVKENILYDSGIARFDGPDILPLSTQLLAPFDPPVRFWKGEIEDQVWTGEPIEILAVDAAKTAQSADLIAEMFFPDLIPGRSVVVQQDFLHWKVPWVPAQMEWMSDCFQPVAVVPRDSVVYLCTAPVTEDALKAGRVCRRRDSDFQAALATAETRLSSWAVADRLRAQARAISLNPGLRRAKDFRRRPRDEGLSRM